VEDLSHGFVVGGFVVGFVVKGFAVGFLSWEFVVGVLPWGFVVGVCRGGFCGGSVVRVLVEGFIVAVLSDTRYFLPLYQWQTQSFAVHPFIPLLSFVPPFSFLCSSLFSRLSS